MDRYNKLNNFLKNKFGERVLKICIDGGFTCPNRDGKCGKGGCIFCGEKGSGERLLSGSISNQVKSYLSSYKAKRANKYIAYFQNFSNTYDSIENLTEKYNSALINKNIIALAIATRPDCINEQIANLLESYVKKGLYVWVELGLQTTNEKVGKVLNRGYNLKDFDNALYTLRQHKIDVVTHFMLGLPNEEENDIKEFVNFVNNRDIQGIKLHSTYIIKNTKLAELYAQKKYTPIEMDDYLDKVIYFITHIKKEVVIHRLTGDAPKELLIAPNWSVHKKVLLNRLENILKAKNLYQGCYYNTDN